MTVFLTSSKLKLYLEINYYAIIYTYYDAPFIIRILLFWIAAIAGE